MGALPEEPRLQIEKLYVYPVKSMRGVDLHSAVLTKYGFLFDRTFLVLQTIDENGDKTYKNMSIANNNEMCRFFPKILLPEDRDPANGTMSILFKPLDGSEPKSIDIPLEPDTTGLEVMDIMMHKSPTKAYRMNDKYNDWLSSCFGYDVILTYIGNNKREVRMSSDSWKTNGASTGGWLSSISSLAGKASEMVGMGGAIGSTPAEINFSDVAPYLFVSWKSIDDVTNRLPEDEQVFDITKFRPNVIVSGAKEPWDEDFWGELTIGDNNTRIECEHNCGRCKSINVDYDTGAQGLKEAGSMLKKLNKDRRVDIGTKWTPVFGRYSFLHPDSEGHSIRIGDEVVVTRVNKERTAFDWKGLSTLPGGGRD